MKFWDLASGKNSKSLKLVPGLRAPLTHARVAFAPDGRRIATIDAKEVGVWDADTGKMVAAIRVASVSGHDNWSKVAFSGDGTRLAICRGRQKDGLTYAVWDVDRDKPIIEFAVPNADWAHLSLSPNGKWLATWEELNVPKPSARRQDDRNLRIIVWDVDTGREVHRFRVVGGTGGHKVCFSPDGKTAAVIGTRIELWDTAAWKKRREVREPGLLAQRDRGRLLSGRQAIGHPPWRRDH